MFDQQKQVSELLRKKAAEILESVALEKNPLIQTIGVREFYTKLGEILHGAVASGYLLALKIQHGVIETAPEIKDEMCGRANEAVRGK